MTWSMLWRNTLETRESSQSQCTHACQPVLLFCKLKISAKAIMKSSTAEIVRPVVKSHCAGHHQPPFPDRHQQRRATHRGVCRELGPRPSAHPVGSRQHGDRRAQSETGAYISAVQLMAETGVAMVVSDGCSSVLARATYRLGETRGQSATNVSLESVDRFVESVHSQLGQQSSILTCSLKVKRPISLGLEQRTVIVIHECTLCAKKMCTRKVTTA